MAWHPSFARNFRSDLYTIYTRLTSISGHLRAIYPLRAHARSAISPTEYACFATIKKPRARKARMGG